MATPQHSTLIKPKALKPGDTLAIISPAAPSAPEDMAKGVAYLESLGFEVKVSPNALSSRYYIAGSDEERLADFHQAFADPQIDGILCARGGYGCMRLLPYIQWDIIRNNPKVFIGFSDLTAILLPMFERTGLIGFHGPMLTSNLIDNDPYTQSELWRQVMGQATYPFTVHNLREYVCFNEGEAEGPIIGGNLSLLSALSGTPYQPNTNGAILFIEDWHEQYYSLDRQFQQLKLAGYFNNIRALVLGDFLEIEAQWPDYPLKDFLRELTAELSVPMGYGVSIGHGDQSATLPIGAVGRFEAASGRFEIVSSPVETTSSSQ